MGWANIYKRRIKIFTLSLIIYLDYKVLQKREKWSSKDKRATLWDKAHERNAKRVLNLIIELEGLWVKLGQYLSTRADVLPEAYISLLKQLQDSLPPRPLQEVCRTIENELGKPVGELFSNFVETPLATASIAQVHRATLNNGQEVVVKVQHEGIKDVILEDLKNATSIVDWIAWAEPQYDLKPLINEWCKEAPKELDFDREAENTRTVSNNLGCRSKKNDATLDNHVDVLIPEVIQSSERVLILEYMDGIRINDRESLATYGVDKKKLVEEITRAYAHQIYIDGFFNGDPHPGNFLVGKYPPHRPILLDFGLTKSLSSSMKQAFAKMFLACAEGDQVALLSAFAEMGLKLRLDLPEQAMEITNELFCSSKSAPEALENIKSMADRSDKNMKVIQEKMKLSEKEIKRFNPVDAFPGDAVIFIRVLNLLQGLSSTLDVRIVYLEIMRPFAELALHGRNIGSGPAISTQWIYDTPVLSDVESKLRQLLLELGSEKILGIQVCAYKDGKVIIDTAGGMLGRYDPRPVQPDSLFPVFSVTKGITAGMLHWLADNGKLKLEENIANIWPDFGNNRKDLIKVHHLLNHTSGLHNALSEIMKENPLAMCDWEECLNRLALSVPSTEPGCEQIYHYLSFGWLCGAIIEHASGKKFQEVLEDAIIRPLNIDGELYIGIPPGVESRLAALTVDMDDINKISGLGNRPDLPSSLQPSDIPEVVKGIPIIFNTLSARRAIIPAANGHCSARALARYYAALATGGIVPSPHPPSSQPPLGSHKHIPEFPSKSRRKKRSLSKELKTQNIDKVAGNKSPDDKSIKIGRRSDEHDIIIEICDHSTNGICSDNYNDKNGSIDKMFRNPSIHDAFLGVGDYGNLALPNGKFGLGFRRFSSSDGSLIGFGHSGMGGSTGFCDIKHDFAIAVTLNKMSLGGVTRSIIQLVCSELNLPVPDEFTRDGERGPDMQLNIGNQHLMGWANIYKRRIKIFTLTLIIYLDYKALQKREKWSSKDKRATLWDKAHERNAKRVLNLIIELEGLWVKLGQYLSTRADVLPEAYISLLKQLQDSLPPRPLQEVCRTIEKDLGKPVGELFSNFVETPLATASIAQVHRATLNNGQEVVVKVQHEGIKDVILEDLKNAKSIVDWIAWAEPQYDFKPLINEWCKEAPKELDFDREAENTRTVSNNLGCRSKRNDATLDNRVDVLIPEVIQSSERVLILEYMDGIRVNDRESLAAYGVDKQKLVEEITRAYAHQIYIDGFFNGDPHPGNFLVSKYPPHRPILLDFGLTKSLSSSMKQAFAKMFLACAEGDQVALLSAFAEMGLKLRLDLPEQAMEITNVLFRNSTSASEALENMKSMANQRDKNMKIIQEKMKLSEKEIKRFNPVDAFPGDAVIFIRVLNLLRGLSSTLDVRIVYLDIMRPFAELALHGRNIGSGPEISTQWIYDTPVLSDVESKLRQLLLELGSEKILGIQVCAYKDGKVIIDTAGGMLGRYDPRPVQPDSLFPVFSVTKGITAGMLHWLADNGKLKLEENIANIWPDFGNNRKDLIKVHHLLNHTSGLHNALSEIMKENPLAMCDWEECLKRLALSVPSTEPGCEQIYHYLSFGWLCGAIIEHASGKKFQEVLEDAIIRPLNIDGELYIGIPPGVESRLAALTVDMDDINKISGLGNRPDLPSSLQPSDIPEVVKGIPIIFNTLSTRRAIIPAANGHCSARALARYYAALATGGIVPSPHPPSSQPPLGSHKHIPEFPSKSRRKKRSLSKELKTQNIDKVAGNKSPDDKSIKIGSRSDKHDIVIENGDHSTNGICSDNYNDKNGSIDRMFRNPSIHDAFLGEGDYGNLALPNGKFGLGFRRFRSSDGSLIGFGHSGIGGSTGFCDIKHDFAIAVTLNKMSLGGVTRSIIQLVCSELNLPVPDEFTRDGERGPDMQLNIGNQVIN
ncbi:Beta-lactamase-related protein [Cinnamomum micranthum f. kanehirae]|uniref:Beta-lactamase-related protein n=1 Tax=Cinnamomum micranthum f. kanehirae TaxID=337451 RepID=A0A3S3MQE9_9MAGN|nr:Beta-lactamase-related protein [Cinnamomum micranthum f. kanehirae]